MGFVCSTPTASHAPAMTIPEAIQEVSGLLETAGLNGENCLWQAKVLVAHTISIRPSQLYLKHDFLLDSQQKEELFLMVKKRISGIPLQHVIGEWDFYGRTFTVDKRALVPRPETELLVEFVTAAELPSRPLILDVGTGSGIIGITLALEIPHSRVIGTDISASAVELANENRQLLNARNYSAVNCHLADIPAIVHSISKDGKFDVIVANLPYIPSENIASLQPEVRNHDPLLALDGGSGGTLLILELIRAIPEKISSGGLVVLETGYDQERSIPALFNGEYWMDVQTRKDLWGNHRMVTAIRR